MDYGAFIVWFLIAGAFLSYTPFALYAILKKRDGDNTHKKAFGCLFLFLVLWSAHVYKTFFLDEALIIASYEGDVAKVKSLLRWGADPQADFEGTTPLEAAKSNNHNEVILLLMKAGAKK